MIMKTKFQSIVFIYLFILSTLLSLCVLSQEVTITINGVATTPPNNFIHIRSGFTVTSTTSSTTNFRLFLVPVQQRETFTPPPIGATEIISNVLLQPGEPYNFNIQNFGMYIDTTEQILSSVSWSDATQVTGTPIEIRAYSTSNMNIPLKTWTFMIVSDCDFLRKFDSNPISCDTHSICHPTTVDVPTGDVQRGYCECNPLPSISTSEIQSHWTCLGSPMHTFTIGKLVDSGAGTFETITSFDKPIHVFLAQTIKYFSNDYSNSFSTSYRYEVVLEQYYRSASLPIAAKQIYPLSSTSYSFSISSPSTFTDQSSPDTLFSHKIIAYSTIAGETNKIVYIINLPPIMIQTQCRYIISALSEPACAMPNALSTLCNPYGTIPGIGSTQHSQCMLQSSPCPVIESLENTSTKLRFKMTYVDANIQSPQIRLFYSNAYRNEIPMNQAITPEIVSNAPYWYYTYTWQIPLPPGEYQWHIAFVAVGSAAGCQTIFSSFTIFTCSEETDLTIQGAVLGSSQLSVVISDGQVQRLHFPPALTINSVIPVFSTYLQPLSTFPVGGSSFDILLPHSTSMISNISPSTLYTLTLPVTKLDNSVTCNVQQPFYFSQVPIIQSTISTYTTSTPYFIFKIYNIGIFKIDSITLTPIVGGDLFILARNEALSLYEEPNYFVTIFKKPTTIMPDGSYNIILNAKGPAGTTTLLHSIPNPSSQLTIQNCDPSLTFVSSPSPIVVEQGTFASNGFTVTPSIIIPSSQLEFFIFKDTTTTTLISTSTSNIFTLRAPVSPILPSGEYQFTYRYTSPTAICAGTLPTVTINPTCPVIQSMTPTSFTSIADLYASTIMVTLNTKFTENVVTATINDLPITPLAITNNNHYFTVPSQLQLTGTSFSFQATMTTPSEPSCHRVAIQPISIVPDVCGQLGFSMVSTTTRRTFETDGVLIVVTPSTTTTIPTIIFAINIADVHYPLPSTLLTTSIPFNYNVKLPTDQTIPLVQDGNYEIVYTYTPASSTPCAPRLANTIIISTAPCPTIITPSTITQFTFETLKQHGYRVSIDTLYLTTTITAILTGESIASIPLTVTKNIIAKEITFTLPEITTSLPVGEYTINVSIASDLYCTAITTPFKLEFEVITPVFDDKIYPVEITINTTRRTITVTWTTGNDHQAQLSQFTIHPMPPTPPTTEESLFPSFTTSYGLLSSINNKSIFSTLSIIPSLSTTQHTVELLLPTLPTHYFPNGFIIMLSPIQHSNDHVIQPTPSTHVTWQWGSFPSSCRTSLQCNNCNDYTSQCISTNIHNYYPPLPTSSYINWFESPLLSTISMMKKCTLLQLKCPLYFETNNDCTQCICQSDNCKKLTRSIQINLQLPQQFINIEQLQIFLQQQTYLIEHYLPLQLINLLQLNQYHINTTGYDIINTLQKTKRTQYQSTNEQLLIEYQTSIGIEQLTLTTLNPSLLNTYSQYINTLLLTITFQPTIPLTTTRYNIQQRFNYLLLQLIKLPLIEFNNNNGHKLLSMNITLQSLPINSNWINYSTLTTSSTSTTSSLPIATTLCSPYNQTNIKSNGLCPLPLPLMLSSSPYWSTCTNIDNNNNIKSQQIKPICYDYNGNTIESIELLSSTTISSLTTTILSSSLSLSSLTNICQKGYINYPFITTTSSRCNYIDNDGNIIPNNEPKQYPTELILTQQTKDISTIDIIYSGSILPLSWEWPLLYPQDATIDILFYPTLTSYSTLLTTTSLSLNSTIIIIPQLLSITTTSRIVIRCTQYRQLITTLPIQLIEPINLCPIINNDNDNNLNHCTINDINSQCNPISGLCQCKSSLYSLQEISQNTLDMKCVLPCYNKCNNNENDCIETSPYQCLQCPISFLGSLCQSYSNELCETSITNNNELYLNQYELYCNNNGYQKQCGQCTCNPLTSYIGDKCHICSLTDRNSLIELKQYNDDEINNQLLCSLPGTNYNETKIHCTQCICYPGYIGTRCEIPSIRGNVIFVNDNNQNNNNQNNIMQQQESNNNNGDDDDNSNKYKYLSKDGQNVIIRDMALSLGIDPSFVTIQTITQIDYNNNQQQQQQQSLSISKSNNYLLSKFQSLLSLQSLQSLQPQQTNNNNNKTTIVTYTISPSINGNGGNSFTNLNDLTNSWNNMQTNFNNLPISSPEVLNEIGIPSSASNATQPCNNNNDCELLIQCDPLLNNNCNDDDNTKNKKSTTIGIIIGIVVGIICVILLFIIVIFSVRYCRNNEKCCFKPEHNTRNGKSRKSGKSNKYHDDDNSHLELGDSTTTTTATTTMSNSSKQTKTNNTAQSSTTTSTSIDLEEITNHGESLPSGWTKHKHTTTGQILYVNQDLMISQKHSPNDEHGDNSGW